MTRTLTLLGSSLAVIVVISAGPVWSRADGSDVPRSERLEVTVHGVDSGAISVALVRASVVGGEEQESVVRTVALEEGAGTTSLELDPQRHWALQALADGFWSPATDLSPGSGSPVALTLFPAGELKARLQAPEQEVVPEQLELRLQRFVADVREGATEAKESFEAACSVEEGRVAGCAVPAGRWNLRLDAPGFGPQFLWDVEIGRGAEVDLGRLVLKKGASIFGRVVTEVGPADPSRASVDLEPVFDRGVVSPKQEREVEQLSQSTKIDSWGHFQFVGVLPGAFEIVVRQPGFMPASRAPIVVEGEGATELDDPIVMRRQLRFSVILSPTVEPGGEPWGVRLYRYAGTELLDQLAAGATDPDGVWRSPYLDAGLYRLSIVDSQDNPFVWHELELAEPEQVVSLDLPLVAVDGKVVLGEAPLEAELSFKKKSGKAKVEARSDEEGEFFVVLPDAGEWLVEVRADEPPVVSKGLEVEIEPPSSDSRTADVVIELPDTTLEGEVIDELGLPVDAAWISLVPQAAWKGALAKQSDPFGRFEMRGMEPGVYSVQAEKEQQSSDLVTIRISEDSPVSERLIVQKRQPMAGRVTFAGQPVAQAIVYAVSLAVDGRLTTMTPPSARTNAQGNFHLTLPKGTETVRLVVLAAGFDLHVQRISKGGGSLEVQLARHGGILHLPLAGTDRGDERSASVLLVNGEPLDVHLLGFWARVQGEVTGEGEELRIPGMPPGEYAYCRLEPQEALLVMGGAALPSWGACERGFLTEAGELRLGTGRA